MTKQTPQEIAATAIALLGTIDGTDALTDRAMLLTVGSFLFGGVGIEPRHLEAAFDSAKMEQLTKRIKGIDLSKLTA